MQPRTWNEGDPEPLDVAAVIDIDRDVWINLEPNSWYIQEAGEDFACSWKTVLKNAPLLEFVTKED
jgi:hypothetical protein